MYYFRKSEFVTVYSPLRFPLLSHILLIFREICPGVYGSCLYHSGYRDHRQWYSGE